jgi:hypothetical protein
VKKYDIRLETNEDDILMAKKKKKNVDQTNDNDESGCFEKLFNPLPPPQKKKEHFGRITTTNERDDGSDCV